MSISRHHGIIFTRKHLITCIVIFAIFLFADVHGKECKKINSCSCRLDDGGIIDLSPISKNDGTAWFASIKDNITIQNRFFWNPCNSFTEGDCKDVAVCREHTNIPNSEYFNVGTQDSAFFVFRNDINLVLGYLGDNSTTVIEMHCVKNTTDDLTVIGESVAGSAIYNMELSSIHACAFYPIVIPPEDEGLSAGWVVFIVMIVLLLGFLLLGTVYNKVYNKAEGVDAVPLLPTVITGCSYLKGCFSGDTKTKTRSQYASV